MTSGLDARTSQRPGRRRPRHHQPRDLRQRGDLPAGAGAGVRPRLAASSATKPDPEARRLLRVVDGRGVGHPLPRPGGTDPRLPEFLPAPRHEGLPLRRGQHGRSSPAPTTAGATAPTARWSACRSSATPTARSSIEAQWGLVEVAQLEQLQRAPSGRPGTPPRLRSSNIIGGYTLYLDLHLDAWDGREGGTEVIGGVHKWLIRATGSSRPRTSRGDRYHGVSHRSVDTGRHRPQRQAAAATCRSATRRAGSTCRSPSSATR